MTEDKLIKIGEWLNTKGYDLDFKDWFWMEEPFIDHTFRDVIELIDEYGMELLIAFCKHHYKRFDLQNVDDANKLINKFRKFHKELPGLSIKSFILRILRGVPYMLGYFLG